jgi:hypothetical protein
VCHRSTSATVSLASGNRAIWSFLIDRTLPCWSRADDGAHVSRFCFTHSSSTSPTERPAGFAFPPDASSCAANRCASRLPPWTVRDICVGRPRASAPVNTRTSHTPGRFSRIVATPATRRRGCDSV